MLFENNRLPLNANVRFTQERLSVLTPPDRKRLEGRIGVVQGYWNESRKPIVYFAPDGNRPDLRLLRVDPRHLELVAEVLSPPESAAPEPQLTDQTGGDEKMSQEELDRLFG